MSPKNLVDTRLITRKLNQILRLKLLCLSLIDNLQFLLNYQDRLNCQVPLEFVKVVAFVLELCRVPLHAEEPWLTEAVDLEPELQQITELI